MNTIRRSFTFICITLIVAVVLLLTPDIALSHAVVATVNVGYQPWHVGVNPATNRIYVSNSDGTVSVVNGANNTVIDTIDPGGDLYLSGVCANPATNRVYVVDWTGECVHVINGADNTVVDTVDVGNSPQDIGVNSTTNRIYVGNTGDDTVSVINGTDNTVVDTVGVGQWPQGVGINESTNRIYVASAQNDTVSVINGADNTVVDTVGVPEYPCHVAVNQVTNIVYITCLDDPDGLAVMNGADNTLIGTVNVGSYPRFVGVNTVTNRVYVSNRYDDSVSIVNGSSNIMVDTVDVGSEPDGIGINTQTNRAYVANTKNNFISVIDSNTPLPTITGLEPTTKNSGESGFYLTVKGKDFIKSSIVKWNGGERSTSYVSGTELLAFIPAADIGQPGTAQVTVFTPDGGTSNSFGFIIQDNPVTISSTWYLAEGTTSWGFSTYISIENPNSSEVKADITYNTADGAVSGGTVSLPPVSQTTVNPYDTLGEKDFSTKVVSQNGATIAVDRTMEWTGQGASSPEAHNSVGVNGAAKTWYLPEGSSNWGFETWLLIQNPGNTEAKAQVTYMIEGEGPQAVEKTIPANSRQSYNMADDIGTKDASIKVESDQPVIPERAMYRNSRREGHDSIGTTTPANDYYLAEGCTGYGPGFTTWVLVQNPNESANNVSITFLTGSGSVAGPPLTMEPNSRKTIKVNDYLPSDTDVSTHVHGDSPIIAERAMYWDGGSGEACHDSIGMASAHTTFYLPDGQTSNGRETWTLVSNPNDTEVQVEISYLSNAGTANKTFSATIPANSRKTFNMAEQGISGRAAVLVTCKTGDRKIMCERAMYWNNRGAGTDTIGGYSD